MPDPYDILTVAAMTDELNATIGNGRIQRIGLLDSRTIGAEIYTGGQRHHLIASADDRSPRLRLAPEMPSLDSALVTPFGLLLRKHVRGGLILGIDQPPLERLVRFSIAKRQNPLKTPESLRSPVSDISADADDDDDEGDDESREGVEIRHVTLYVELMGRHSNLILVDDDGRIMESAKRVTPAMSRVRQVLPRLPYIPPPPPDRLDPRSISVAEATRFLAGVAPDADLARVLVSHYRGISPLMAREIVYQISGRTGVRGNDVPPQDGEALAGAIRQLFDSLATTSWGPRIYRERGGDEPGSVVTFAPVPMTHLAAAYGEEETASVSTALALAEGVRTSDGPGQVRHAQRRQRLLAAVTSAREKAERRLAALANQSLRAAEAERLKTRGEFIYQFLWQIEPGQRELVTEGETIALDPALSASENAQSYFERYRKAQSAEAQLPGLANESRAEIAYLDQLATLIAQAPGFSELEALSAEWADLDSSQTRTRPRRKSAPKRPRALIDAAGNSVYVGRSGTQNDLLTFEIAGPDDTWLHARGVGGSHVVIRWRTPDTPEHEDTIAAAAALASWYSAARSSGAVEVDVARRRHVRKLKGAKPGMVTYRNERTIRVQPAPEERLRDVLLER
ncbi:MAG: NFACT family protein [Chloroflexia bacterium]|nr:NFACT family protein [Chloroflexia bacterium]